MEPPQISDLLQRDPYLEPYASRISARSPLSFSSPSEAPRYSYYCDWVSKINEHEGGLEKFSRGYEMYGFNEAEDGTISFAEWCPGARSMSLIGDFSS
jgi:1,4-alpha-glucan branching enzyme